MAATTADRLDQSVTREHPAMQWGAVWAGWFVATGSAIVLYLFGLAIGLSAFDPRNAAALARGLSAGAIVWMILTWGAALWTGAMFASWFDGRNDTEMGVVRGLAVWGVSMAATGLLVMSGLAHTGLVAVVPRAAVTPLDPTRVAHHLAAFMWTAFGSAVLALVTSVFGGWMGAHHVHRVYHLRHYAPHGRES